MQVYMRYRSEGQGAGMLRHYKREDKQHRLSCGVEGFAILAWGR